MVFPSWFTSGKLSAVCAGRPVSLSSLVATTATLGAAAPGHPAAVADTVASGPARSLGEPTAAQDSAVTAVVATSFWAAGAQVRAWTKPAQAPS